MVLSNMDNNLIVASDEVGLNLSISKIFKHEGIDGTFACVRQVAFDDIFQKEQENNLL